MCNLTFILFVATNTFPTLRIYVILMRNNILYPYLHLFTPICFGYQYIYLFMLLNISYLLQCIELYTNQDGDQNIGFYSLEMASDLELDPKQYHMIAFEDAGDCKNMCYIIQSHLEMLGNGNAFVIAQQPKVRIDP